MARAAAPLRPIFVSMARGFVSMARTKALQRLWAVPREELRTAAALAFYVFILLGSYYVLKTVREALILAEDGAAVKVYAGAVQAAVLMAVVPLYSALANRMPRVRLIGAVLAFFSAVLVAFAVAGQSGLRIGVPFFLWIGVFNVFVIAQFWSFAADLFSEKDGLRVFPFVGVGATLGGWLGSVAAKQMFSGWDPYAIVWLAAAALAASIPLTYLISRQRSLQPDAEKTKAPLASIDGLRLIFGDRYLRLIAAVVVLLNVCSTTGEYIFGSIALDHAKAVVAAGQHNGLTEKQIIGTIYAGVFSWVNALGLVFQLILVPVVFQRAGLGAALFILPAAVLAGYSFVALVPALGIARFTRVIESAISYSLQSTTNNGLFLATAREAKYKAKVAIDTVFWRLGDVLSAGLVYVGASVLSLSRSGFAVANVAIACVWTAVAAALFREYRRRGRPVEGKPEKRRKHYVEQTHDAVAHC